MERTRAFRKGDQLFVSWGKPHRGKPIAKQRLSHWIADAIMLVYSSSGLQVPAGLRAHSTRVRVLTTPAAITCFVADFLKTDKLKDDPPFQFSIRGYAPSDQDVVVSLFRNGILEHVYPAFFRAMSHPDHIGVALSISMAGYVLGGSSYFQAFLFGSAWAGFIYYCCHEIYEGYMMTRLSTDMADIQANYLDNPDNGFWVAETEVNGQSKVVGMVAVTGKRRGEVTGSGRDDQNGGVMVEENAHGAGDGGFGELHFVVVSFVCRRKGLGSQLSQKALDFCKERGYNRLVLDTSSPQTAATSLYNKLGFVQTSSHNNTHRNRWFSKMARINVMRLEKFV
ncbi:N-acetyltransferase family 8 member 3 [Lampris incognitus]|uniref:N-acetyltransferase family 8 member 3 n=1 Tax=Lampris incognitus TaxID=2546036 RepID=UPI0024B4D951|nr:N-acetyltransferase family 8 member 3 [Lampris incognitus]